MFDTVEDLLIQFRYFYYLLDFKNFLLFTYEQKSFRNIFIHKNHVYINVYIYTKMEY